MFVFVKVLDQKVVDQANLNLYYREKILWIGKIKESQNALFQNSNITVCLQNF